MKILIVRFSSIGDIILTTPILRALKTQIPGVELHYLTKKPFVDLVKNNPHLTKIFAIEKSVDEAVLALTNEKYDLVIDLHKNLRTLQLRRKLNLLTHTFPKLNLKKWLYVNFNWDLMPDLHIVDRYYDAVRKLKVQNDLLNCEVHLTTEDAVYQIDDLALKSPFIAYAIGTQFETKQIPIELAKKILAHQQLPIVLMGGMMDHELAESIKKLFPEKKIYNACGPYTLLQSASIVSQAKVLLTGDTGMMHLATCFMVPIVSVWGNTTPKLGMYPYYPMHKELYSIHEVSDLNCRPCSKIGYKSCPKKHFDCMLKQDVNQITKQIELFIDKRF